jgi:thiol-disulfide isomerase/thioredoxin
MGHLRQLQRLKKGILNKYGPLMIKYYLFILLFPASLKSFSQDSCFMRPALEPLEITRNIDSIHLLLKAYNEAFKGCKAPDLNCTSIDNVSINSKDLRGKVTVLNFWFTHCKPCVAEFASLNKLVDTYRANDVQFISLAIDKKAVIDTFLASHPLQYAVVPGATSIMADFKISSYPTNIILDKDWRVVQIITGGEGEQDNLKNYSRIKSFIDEVLSK